MNVISVDELKLKMDKGEKLNLIDVREPHENADFNIGGILLPLGKVQTMQIESIDNLKTEPVIVYCRSGNRSMQAAMLLEQFGFENVTNLAGGMLAWEAKFGR
ncbi:rhodanese-like domain-containing protein [Hydrotalea sandarakina]|jgi:rhodanese-related sulfurtransferase|uniref:Rhodanese-related sulfurtransferase n=1 Tax=Hydrotalea sandarakina TaxID=1004304 RepID=A0A2W7TF34_9BACT|nr:rhodanese-like domain-containing protein [Hydrotalea sandarakina]PZX61922.1 rhodanese-related sulfurtransferase [Hydrotalea sandarakina]